MKAKTAHQRIQEERQKIDSIDIEILEKILLRHQYSLEIGNLKQLENKSIYKPDREHSIIKRLLLKRKQLLQHKAEKTVTKKVFPEQSLKSIFQEIISSCRSAEDRLKIAYLGPQGSFSYLAALEKFGSSVDLIPYVNFNSIFRSLSSGDEDWAILPLENSIEGMVSSTIDLMVAFNITIVSEIYLPISLCLLSPENDLKKIHSLYSHYQPFQQSSNWLATHLPKVQLKETLSSSKAAQLSSKHAHTACIASEKMRLEYPSLHLLRKNIEDQHNNKTRFVVIRSGSYATNKEQEEQASSVQKNSKIQNKQKLADNMLTSMIVAIKDKPGALYEILDILYKKKINLTNLVSRPSKRKAFDYLFFIDFIGIPEDATVASALAKLQKKALSLKILGCYYKNRS